MTRAILETLIDKDILAACEALDQVNWKNDKGTFEDIKQKFIDPPIGSNKSELREQLKLLLRKVIPIDQNQEVASTSTLSNQHHKNHPYQATNQIDTQGHNNQYNQGISNSEINTTVNNYYGISAAPSSLDHDSQEWFKEELKNAIYTQESSHEARLVDCNRINEVDKMKAHWKKTIGHKFFFIVSCSSQQPDSLIQRFISSMNQIKPGQINTSHEQKYIEYLREKENGGKTTLINVTKIEASTELGWFMQDFVEQIDKFNTNQIGAKPEPNHNVYESNEVFQAFIQEKLVQQNTYQNCTFAYEFDALEWQNSKNFSTLLKDWLNIFSTNPNNGPNCHFFFILKIPRIHSRKDLEQYELDLLKSIQKIANSKSLRKQTLLVGKLDRVGLAEIQSWVNKMIKASAAREKLFVNWHTKYIDPLPPDDKLDMEIVAMFMRSLWSYAYKSQNTAQS